MQHPTSEVLLDSMVPAPAEVTVEQIAVALAGVILAARSQGQSLEELLSEILEDDALLAQPLRQRLSRVVQQAWEVMDADIAQA
ncbi:MAG: hypothetical protein HC886_04250 [Leptolyngbyaceae cyanobacterium SM1_1_3]|nr:hypothetical protein [Leptolyngbyaceae cyanobacterium SM1_1_3]NJN03034.1 hypothetical protein [Leptolyngbyaceae cyanobacterium RM1_1_2]NJO08388.1 hypothetical protein [Leptolyngbyaceae cyanobacterium SL_1_1]